MRDRKSRTLVKIVIACVVGAIMFQACGGAIDHMLDPCRTYDLKRMNPTCR